MPLSPAWLLLVVFAATVTVAARQGSFAPATPASVVRPPWLRRR
ncbi:hypothetical protein [Geodermatophilus sp. URMC 63]